MYLRYWPRHHGRLFDHGVLLDYGSTDRSREIIAELAPRWEIRRSRNAMFHSLSIDAEVMDVERELGGWKMCLNVTEFVIHHDLRALQTHRPAAGVVTTGFIIQDTPDQLGVPLDASRELWEQRHFGCPEPDLVNGHPVLRRRLLHRAPDGRYGPGRHSNGVSDAAEPNLHLFWYGWCPLAMKMHRNRSTRPMVLAEDLNRGWGTHHVMDDAQAEAAWRTYLPQYHDLLAGHWPELSAAVEVLRNARSAGEWATSRTGFEGA